MQLTILFVAFALLAVPAPLFAQDRPSTDEPSEQAAHAQRATELAQPSPSPIVPVEPPSLIPPNILPGPNRNQLPHPPTMPEIEQLNAFFKQTSLGKAADEQRLRVQTAELELRLRGDVELKGAEAFANAAPTDLEKRLRLKTYYHRFYDQLRSMTDSPELKTYLDGQELAHLATVSQPRVRPTTNPAPSAAPTLSLPKPVQAMEHTTVRQPGH